MQLTTKSFFSFNLVIHCTKKTFLIVKARHKNVKFQKVRFWSQQESNIVFYMVPSSEETFSDHLLEYIFQSSLRLLHIFEIHAGPLCWQLFIDRVPLKPL